MLVPTGPVLVFSEIDGVTVNVAVGANKPPCVAVTVSEPAACAGIVIDWLKAPDECGVITVVPVPYVIVTCELAVKPEPVTVVIVPTGPVLELNEIVG